MLHRLQSLYDTLPWDFLHQYSIHRPTIQLAELSERLPRAFIEGCIEWPLAPNADDIDIWGTIPYDENGRQACASFLRNSKSQRGQGGWAGLDRLMRDWVEPQRVAHDLIGDLFLEFDSSHAIPKLQPIVVAGLMGPPASPLLAVQGVNCYRSLMLDRPIVDETRLRNVLDHLPRTAAVRNVAIMQRAGKSPTRLSVWMNVLSVEACIDRLQAQVAMSQVRNVLDCIRHNTTLVGLQIDVGSLDTIGIEIALPSNELNPRHFNQLFDFLQADTACDARKREMIEHWIRGTHLEGFYRNLIVKVTASRNGNLRSKAYLGFSPAKDRSTQKPQ